MQETMDRLRTSPGVLAVVLTDLDGAILYAASDLDIAPPIIRGMVLSLTGYLQQIVTQLGMGKITEFDAETSMGHMFVVHAGAVVLIVLATRQSNLGTLRMALARAVRGLSEDA